MAHYRRLVDLCASDPRIKGIPAEPGILVSVTLRRYGQWRGYKLEIGGYIVGKSGKRLSEFGAVYRIDCPALDAIAGQRDLELASTEGATDFALTATQHGCTVRND